MGQGWGGEGSSAGHQLLSDYIIPDIKTTHTARVPAGGPERRAEAESGPASPRSRFPFSPRSRSRTGKWAPLPALPKAQRPPPARQREDGERGQLPEPRRARRTRRRPGDLSAGPRRGGSAARGAGGRVPGASPRPRRASPDAHLCGTQAPEPIHMVRSPPSSSAAAAAPGDPVAAAGSGAGGPAEGAEGAAPGLPGPEAGSFPGAAAGWCGAVRAAALCAPGEPSGRGVKRRAPGRRRTRGSEGSFASVPAAGRRAGLDDLRFSTTPPPHPRQPPPRRLSSDRWRDCNDALPLLRLLPATRAGCACPSSLSPVRRGRDTPQEWQAALPYPRAPREPRAATIGAGAGAVLKWVGPPSG